jgi:hypothetical protein
MRASILAVLLCAVSLLACSDAEGGSDDTPILTDRPPDTTASAAGTTVDMGVGTYCWTGLCVDSIGPATRGKLTVRRGDEVTVAVPAGGTLSEVQAYLWPASGPRANVQTGETVWSPAQVPNPFPKLPVRIDGGEVRVTVDAPAGQHVLVVGMWIANAGDAQYGVLIDVQ